ncbi:MAG: hypothetical protein FJW32_26270 [Acidobacteria bacterium]|nr:hypothetical protein [Acidobacteriota bacterium]
MRSIFLLILLLPSFGQESEAHKATFMKVCANCHKPEVVLSARRTKSQWEDTFEKMVARGAKGTDDEFTSAFLYLMTNFGKVNVNRAPADELMQVLGINDEVAAAIIKYRRGKGRIEDVEDLAKVPGIDAKRLEEKREAIAF